MHNDKNVEARAEDTTIVAGRSHLLQVNIRDAFGNAVTELDALSASAEADPAVLAAQDAWMLTLQEGWPQYGVQLQASAKGGATAVFRSNVSGTFQVLLLFASHCPSQTKECTLVILEVLVIIYTVAALNIVPR